MPAHINIQKNADDLNLAAANWIVDLVNKTLEEQDRFTICLSGGNTPKKLYQLLASEKFKNKIDWKRMHIFWGDERYVPFDDERNNAKMAFDALLHQVPVPPSQIHIMRTDIDPENSAKEYEKLLKQYFIREASYLQHNIFNNRESHNKKPQTFDLILLGLGDNAHTLSLFPGYNLVQEKKYWVSSFFLKEQNMYRITLTSPVVNLSASIAFLVSGKEKAKAVQNVIEGKYDPESYPAQIIQPVNGKLFWFLDEEAAGKLKK